MEAGKKARLSKSDKNGYDTRTLKKVSTNKNNENENLPHTKTSLCERKERRKSYKK